MITIVDYGVGNINAFVNVFNRIDVLVKVANCAEDLFDAKKIILPGVGHFDFAISRLIESGMRPLLDELVLGDKIPVLGVCVGMQIMSKNSEEGIHAGLNWVDANVRKFDITNIGKSTKLPHMGWNDVEWKSTNILFRGFEKEALFYFLHSYYIQCTDNSDVIGTTDFGGIFTSAINHDNIFGVQFHPEKSHSYGEKLLQNFANL